MSEVAAEGFGMERVSDGKGAVYLLPSSLRVMDCSSCGRFCVRHKNGVPVAYRREVESFGGYTERVNGHQRPVCSPCWVLTQASLGRPTYVRPDRMKRSR